MTFSSEADKVIPQMVAATETVMEAASEVSSVKRVVLTSSSTAASIAEPGRGRLVLNQGQPPIYSPKTTFLECIVQERELPLS